MYVSLYIWSCHYEAESSKQDVKCAKNREYLMCQLETTEPMAAYRKLKNQPVERYSGRPATVTKRAKVVMAAFLPPI